jgi:hypothetical protein
MKPRLCGPSPAAFASSSSLPGSVWIDAYDGTATPAVIGEGQLRRRLVDNASFDVRVP